MTVKRFWAFTGADYYPGGGCNDAHAAFDTIDEAVAWIREHGEDWAHIHDMLSDVEVSSFDIVRGPLRYVDGVGRHDRILRRWDGKQFVSEQP